MIRIQISGEAKVFDLFRPDTALFSWKLVNEKPPNKKRIPISVQKKRKKKEKRIPTIQTCPESPSPCATFFRYNQAARRSRY